jgi:hypothetical protein
MRPKLIYRRAWCIVWEGKIYPFGPRESALGAASTPDNRVFNPFIGYTLEQAESLGYIACR